MKKRNNIVSLNGVFAILMSVITMLSTMSICASAVSVQAEPEQNIVADTDSASEQMAESTADPTLEENTVEAAAPAPVQITISAAALTNEQITERLTQLQAIYLQGSTWLTPGTLKYGGYQCYAYARQLAVDVFGSYPAVNVAYASEGQVSNGWTAIRNPKNVTLEPGDIIRADNNQHTAMIWKIEGDRVYVAECWGNSNNKLNWGNFNGNANKSTTSYLLGSGFTGVWKHPNSGSPTSSMTITNQTIPFGTLQQGKCFGIKGKITSNLKITLVSAGVYFDDWTVTSEYVEVKPNSTTYDLNTYVNDKIIFNHLAEGKYHYLVCAWDTSGKKYDLVNSAFEIRDVSVTTTTQSTAKQSSMSITNQTIPSGTLQQGKCFGIKGKITSNLKITLVAAGVYFDDWTVTSEYVEVKPNSTTYDLNTYVNDKIIFNHLAEGKYHYLVCAWDTSGKKYDLVNSAFEIRDVSVTTTTQTTVAPSVSQYAISRAGIELICGFEGFHATCYQDGTQSSIGFGTKCTGSSQQPHAAGAHSITREQAMAEMKSQLASRYEPNVRKQTSGISMTQNQYDVLCSLCYNTGGGNTIISNSPLVKYLKGSLTEAQARSEYANYYVSSNGKKLSGLVNRRNKEADYFFAGSVLTTAKTTATAVKTTNTTAKTTKTTAKPVTTTAKTTKTTAKPVTTTAQTTVTTPKPVTTTKKTTTTAKPVTTTTTSTTTSTTTTATTSVKPVNAVLVLSGDVNCDGKVDVSDAVLLSRFITEDPAAHITAIGRSVADANGDGNLTQDDIIYILQVIAKII